MRKIILSAACLLSFMISKAQLYSFESWQNYTVGAVPLTAPTGWHAIDSSIVLYGIVLNPGAPFYAQVEKATPGNGSASALRVFTKTQSELTGFFKVSPFPSICSNSVIEINATTGSFNFIGGFPYLNNPLNASMWVKNNPVGGDSTEITILAIDNSDGGDSIAGIADTMLGATINTFTKITLPFVYNASGFNTTMLRVIVTSSGNATVDTSGAFVGLHDGTSITVDDIDIAAPNGVVQYLYSSKAANIYPTEVTDNLNINLQKLDGDYLIEIHDMKGSKMISSTLSTLLNKIDISNFSKGSYIFSLMKDKKIVQTGKLMKL